MPSILRATLALVVVLPLAVQAQAPVRGTTRVGDVHVYAGEQRTARTSYEETVTVTEVGDAGIKTMHKRADQPDTAGDFDRDWNPRATGGSGVTNDPINRFLTFPLEPGRAWSNSFMSTFRSGGKAKVDADYKVVGPERIKTPAGEFDTVRVDGKGYAAYQGGGPFRGGSGFTQSVWYAPAIDRVVRIEFKEQRTMGADTVIVLKEFKPAQ